MKPQDFNWLLTMMKSCGYKEVNRDTILNFYERFAGSCKMCQHSCRPVLAEGDWNSKVLIISNRTTKTEDQQNKIFPPGTLEGSQLKKYLEPLGLIRQDCVICNSIQGFCLRDVEPDNCSFWSRLIINVLAPKLIIILGLETAYRYDLEQRVELNSLNYMRDGHVPTLILAHPSLNNLRQDQHLEALEFLQKLDKTLLGDYKE